MLQYVHQASGVSTANTAAKVCAGSYNVSFRRIIDHYEEILAPGLQFDSQARPSVRPQEGSMSPYSGSGLRRKTNTHTLNNNPLDLCLRPAA